MMVSHARAFAVGTYVGWKLLRVEPTSVTAARSVGPTKTVTIRDVKPPVKSELWGVIPSRGPGAVAPCCGLNAHGNAVPGSSAGRAPDW